MKKIIAYSSDAVVKLSEIFAEIESAEHSFLSWALKKKHLQHVGAWAMASVLLGSPGHKNLPLCSKFIKRHYGARTSRLFDKYVERPRLSSKS